MRTGPRCRCRGLTLSLARPHSATYCERMTLECDDLEIALQENLKLRRQLATGLAQAKGKKLAAVRYRLARIVGAIRFAFSGRSRRASVSKAVVELMTLDGAREQYASQLRQLDNDALLKEIEQLRRLIEDLASRDKSA
jgi:cell division protein FtsB